MSLREICSNAGNQLSALASRTIAGARPYLERAVNRCPSIDKKTGIIAVAVLSVIAVVGVVVRNFRAKKATAQKIASFMARPSWHLQEMIEVAKKGDKHCYESLITIHVKKPIEGFGEIRKAHFANRDAYTKAKREAANAKKSV